MNKRRTWNYALLRQENAFIEQFMHRARSQDLMAVLGMAHRTISDRIRDLGGRRTKDGRAEQPLSRRALELAWREFKATGRTPSLEWHSDADELSASGPCTLYSVNEERYIEENVAHLGLNAVAKALGRSRLGIRFWLNKHGLEHLAHKYRVQTLLDRLQERHIRLSGNAVRRWIEAGYIRAVKDGNAMLINPDDFEYLAENYRWLDFDFAAMRAEIDAAEVQDVEDVVVHKPLDVLKGISRESRSSPYKADRWSAQTVYLGAGVQQ